MPVSREYEQRVLGLLGAVRPVTHRKMFGGIGLYLDGPVFGIVDDDRLFFKVDEATVAPYDEAGAEMWMYDPAVGPVPKYREVPSHVLAEPQKLGEWIDAAAGAAVRLDSKSTQRKKRG